MPFDIVGPPSSRVKTRNLDSPVTGGYNVVE